MKESTTAKPARVRRSPVGVKNRLSVKEQDPNFQYRIVNDVDDRVQELIDQGYVVDAEAKVGSKRVDNSSGIGGRISVGNGLKAVVMKQRKDYYEEDQAIKQQSILDLEQSMNETAKRGT